MDPDTFYFYFYNMNFNTHALKKISAYFHMAHPPFYFTTSPLAPQARFSARGSPTPTQQVGNLSEHVRRKSIWRHILIGVFREFIWF